MYASMRKYLGLPSSLKLKKSMEVSIIEKQGILSVLGSDKDTSNNPSAGSLRRTLSADMSSKSWLSEYPYLHPVKKTASSVEFSVSESNLYSSSSSDDETEDELRKMKKNGEFSPWSSILTQKGPQEDENRKSPPYVHPLEKMSKRSLSEKSLAICTESLGSESGSDETGDMEEGRIMRNISCLASKKLTQRSFPPPIPSLSHQEGSSVYMKTRRDKGRLVLEAVKIPTNNNFHAERQDGRLLLTFAESSDDSSDGEQAEEEDIEREEGKEMEEEKKVRFVEKEFSCGFVKGCKEQKMSPMFWEPYCVATS